MDYLRLFAVIAFSAAFFGCIFQGPGGTFVAPNGTGIQNQTDNSTLLNVTNGSAAGSSGGNGSSGEPGNQSGDSGNETLPTNETGNETSPEMDTVPPYVTALGLSDSLITRADIGSTFTLKINYSEPMGPSDPTISFEPSLAAISGFGIGTWTDAATYEISYPVPDAAIDIRGIGLNITGARDVAGNAQTEYDMANALDIDTVAPNVTSVEVSDSFVDRNDIGGTFFVTIGYSEPMGPGAPAITFNQDVTVLAPANGTWTDAFTYRAFYSVNDIEERVVKVKVNAGAAHDAAGNPQAKYTSGALFDIDTYRTSDGGGGGEPR